MIQLETQLKIFYYLNQTTFNFNKISCDQQQLQQQQLQQQQLQQQQLQQQQLQQQQQQQKYFSIFNTTNSILLAKPQTIKKSRASNRGKKNSTALQF
jgi:hypothetical protein